MAKLNYEEFRVPKSWGYPERISHDYEKEEGVKRLHMNGANDIYKFPSGIVIVNKLNEEYDQLEIAGEVKASKLRLEKILGEEF